MAWPLVVEACIKEGLTSVDQLANIVFYLHHSERIGHPLGVKETRLINQ